MDGVTHVLNGLDGEDDSNELLALIYRELRQMASAKMAGEAPGQTLQATALVHEAWMRLSAVEHAGWKNRRHFFGAAAEVMRRILVEKARSRNALKRGGGMETIPLDDVQVATPLDDEKLLLVHEALERLALHDPEKAEIVKLRFFAGLGHKEIAALLDVSEKTVKRHWTYSKAWLYNEIEEQLH